MSDTENGTDAEPEDKTEEPEMTDAEKAERLKVLFPEYNRSIEGFL